MIRPVEMEGKKFGDWTVLRRDEERRGKGAYWICQCKCGKVRSVQGNCLRKGGSKGCGCARTETIRKNAQRAAWASNHENARRAGRGICYNVFCPQRDNYKGAWSCRHCHGCAGRGLERTSKREVLEI